MDKKLTPMDVLKEEQRILAWNMDNARLKMELKNAEKRYADAFKYASRFVRHFTYKDAPYSNTLFNPLTLSFLDERPDEVWKKEAISNIYPLLSMNDKNEFLRWKKEKNLLKEYNFSTNEPVGPVFLARLYGLKKAQLMDDNFTVSKKNSALKLIGFLAQIENDSRWSKAAQNDFKKVMKIHLMRELFREAGKNSEKAKLLTYRHIRVLENQLADEQISKLPNLAKQQQVRLRILKEIAADNNGRCRDGWNSKDFMKDFIQGLFGKKNER